MATSHTHHKRVKLHYTVFEQTHGLSFPVMGQGTVSVTPKSVEEALRIVLSTTDGRSVGITIGRNEVRLWDRSHGKESTLAHSKDPLLLLNPSDHNLPYWLSLDTHNKRLRYGKGEMLGELKLLEYSWAGEKGSDYEFFKLIQRIDIEGAKAVETKVLAVPVTVDPSPHIIAGSAVTMEILANNTATVISDLPVACHRLYENVAGPGVNLSPADFPDFAEAIQYSITTPHRLCHEKLAEKNRETEGQFGYLRVTLDANMGDSPGQPYVLEIWPAGNGSPIHDHGRACAVIKVLHGNIQVSWFSALSPEITDPWGSMIAHAGEVTFLTPDYYQIHRLHNPSSGEDGEFCATIQCYRYADDDSKHYEYFDYVQGSEIKHFEPDSDWEYLKFKQAILEEWTQAKNNGEVA
jgi:hypothetical protein